MRKVDDEALYWMIRRVMMKWTPSVLKDMRDERYRDHAINQIVKALRGDGVEMVRFDFIPGGPQAYPLSSNEREGNARTNAERIRRATATRAIFDALCELDRDPLERDALSMPRNRNASSD